MGFSKSMSFSCMINLEDSKIRLEALLYENGSDRSSLIDDEQ